MTKTLMHESQTGMSSSFYRISYGELRYSYSRCYCWSNHGFNRKVDSELTSDMDREMSVGLHGMYAPCSP